MLCLAGEKMRKKVLIAFFFWTGMNESNEFAEKLFDTLTRQRGITSSTVLKAELREFWEQITDQSFDVGLRTFFDM